MRCGRGGDADAAAAEDGGAVEEEAYEDDGAMEALLGEDEAGEEYAEGEEEEGAGAEGGGADAGGMGDQQHAAGDVDTVSSPRCDPCTCMAPGYVGCGPTCLWGTWAGHVPRPGNRVKPKGVCATQH